LLDAAMWVPFFLLFTWVWTA